MTKAGNHHLQKCKLKAGAREYVDKTFFCSDANVSDKFYGVITKVLHNDNIRGTLWDIDNTLSIVSP